MKKITFEEAWKKMEATGYQYGEDALMGVRLGWKMREEYADEEAEHQREAGVLLHALFITEGADLKVRDAALAWVKKDLERLSNALPTSKKKWGMQGKKWGGKKEK